jgi:ribosome biogenesis protein Tsr3
MMDGTTFFRTLPSALPDSLLGGCSSYNDSSSFSSSSGRSSPDVSILIDSDLSIIDCSWARIFEIPFRRMKKSTSYENHRLLHYVVAAHTVIYGKQSKKYRSETTISSNAIISLLCVR